jgi:(S)-ureidoglycine aminohydrolase
MHTLGQTRSAHRADHILQTPDTFVRAPLPGMKLATAVVHVGTAAGAKFTQYTAEFEPGGSLGPASAQRFVYVLEGDLTVDARVFGPGGYAYLPEKSDVQISARRAARAVVIEKPYSTNSASPRPAFFMGEESTVAPEPLQGDPWIGVRTLVPEGFAHDLAVNTMTYQPGAALPIVELHFMEHGLLMLEGGGVYRLGDFWYPVTAGDFIWMAPHCPQWFGALGKTPAKYLIYKDWNRHPLVEEA